MSAIHAGFDPEKQSKSVLPLLWANHLMSIIALGFASYVLMSWWSMRGDLDNIQLLSIGAWTTLALAASGQLLLRRVRESYLVRLALITMAAGALCMVASLLIAAEDFGIALTISSILLFVGSTSLFVAHFRSRPNGLFS